MRHFKSWSLVQLGLGLALGGLALFAALRQADGVQLLPTLRQLHCSWYGLAFLTVLAVSAGKAWRWQVLYPSSAEPLPWREHFAILLIAQMLNILIPIRLGEVARLGLMQQARRPLGMTLGTIAAEKAMDLITTGALLLFTLPFLVWQEARLTALTVLGSGLGLLLGLIMLGLTHTFWLRLLDRCPRPRYPRWAALWERALRLPQALLAWAGTLSTGRWIGASLLSVGVWALSLLCIVLVLRAFEITSTLIALLLMLAITFTNLLPQPPAMLGTVLFVTQQILTPFGFTPAQGLAIGSALNVVMVLPIALGGAWSAGIRATRLLTTPASGRLRQALGLDVLLRGRRRDS